MGRGPPTGTNFARSTSDSRWMQTSRVTENIGASAPTPSGMQRPFPLVQVILAARIQNGGSTHSFARISDRLSQTSIFKSRSRMFPRKLDPLTRFMRRMSPLMLLHLAVPPPNSRIPVQHFIVIFQVSLHMRPLSVAHIVLFINQQLMMAPLIHQVLGIMTLTALEMKLRGLLK